MHPLLFEIPIPFTAIAVPVRAYGLMMFLGFFAGVYTAARRARAVGLRRTDILDMALWGAVFGVLGARLLHVIENFADYSPFRPEGFDVSRILSFDPGKSSMLAVWDGGLTFYGAMLAAVATAWGFCRAKNAPVWAVFDIAAPGLIVGQAFGRVGCLFAGCCYGKICDHDFPLALRFPALEPAWAYAEHAQLLGVPPDDPFYSYPVYPTQLMAIVGALLIAAALYCWWPKRRHDGQIFSACLVMVGLTRFCEELFRASDPAGIPFLSRWMTATQWISVGMIVVGAAFWLWSAKRGKTDLSLDALSAVPQKTNHR